MPLLEDYPSPTITATSQSGSSNTSSPKIDHHHMLKSPSSHLLNTTAPLHGSLIFYIQQHRPRHHYNYHSPRQSSTAATITYGLRRGPIYHKSTLSQYSRTPIFSTACSSTILAQDEGFIQDVTLIPTAGGGCFIIQLRGKDLYVVDDDGGLMVAMTRRDEATKFAGELRVDGAGRIWWVMKKRWWVGSGTESMWGAGDAPGSNKLDKGNGKKTDTDLVWVLWVSDEEKRERAKKNKWGIWAPDYDFLWK